MQSITKRDLVDQIALKTNHKRALVREITQEVLNAITSELVQGHRIEMRDFGVFIPVFRPAKVAQNPKTLERVQVPAKYSIRFKPGRFMKEAVASGVWAQQMLEERREDSSVDGKVTAASNTESAGTDGLPMVHTVAQTAELHKNR